VIPQTKLNSFLTVLADPLYLFYLAGQLYLFVILRITVTPKYRNEVRFKLTVSAFVVAGLSLPSLAVMGAYWLEIPSLMGMSAYIYLMFIKNLVKQYWGLSGMGLTLKEWHSRRQACMERCLKD
jgi:hypothetical protein